MAILKNQKLSDDAYIRLNDDGSISLVKDSPGTPGMTTLRLNKEEVTAIKKFLKENK